MPLGRRPCQWQRDPCCTRTHAGSVKSDAQGEFTLEGDFTTFVSAPVPGVSSLNISGTKLTLQVTEAPVLINISLHDISGKVVTRVLEQSFLTGNHLVTLPEPFEILSHGISLL